MTAGRTIPSSSTPSSPSRTPTAPVRSTPSGASTTAFGDEGGVHVTARDLRELFRQLACDRPLWVDWAGAGFGEYEGYHREGDGRGQARETYLAWLDQHVGLPPAEDPNDLVEPARRELGAGFRGWAGRFVDGL